MAVVKLQKEVGDLVVVLCRRRLLGEVKRLPWVKVGTVCLCEDVWGLMGNTFFFLSGSVNVSRYWPATVPVKSSTFHRPTTRGQMQGYDFIRLKTQKES